MPTLKQRYVVGQRLKIGDGIRYPGEPVPEAADWKHLESYLSSGQVIIEQYIESEEDADTPDVVEDAEAEAEEAEADSTETNQVEDTTGEEVDDAEAQSEEPAGNVADDTTGLEEIVARYHTGGGWYEFPNGLRVRGKPAAVEAMLTLTEEADSEEE